MIRRLLLALALAAGFGGAAHATCAPLPYDLVAGTTARASQVMADLNALLNCINPSLVTLSGPLGPIGDFTAQTHQNQGGISGGTHNVLWTDANNGVAADYFALQSGDQSLQNRLTVATPQAGDI